MDNVFEQREIIFTHRLTLDESNSCPSRPTVYGKPNGAKFKKQNCLHIQQIFIKVKRDFNQAHQNQVTFNGFSFKVTAYFNQAQQQKLTHSTNFNSTPREYCVKLKK